ncbi:hypothetical protein [Gracilibacillus saliphilus]|uniref:hypothetical protein n=1 Tax=Gracilibacillus saliphilus TaxID=543890 RepID=UPI0013D05062|nr:hypothetical protein [Gracilibacillus saliphilus]
MAKVVMAEFLKGFQLQWNYPFSFLLHTIQNLIITGVLIWMLSGLTSLEQVIGLLFWPVVISAISSSAQSVQDDMQYGTFERIAASKRSLSFILLARSLSDFIFSALLTIIAIAGATLLFDISLRIEAVAACLFIVLFTGTGLSFILTGLQIYYRDIGPLGNMIVFGSVVVLLLPWDQWLQFFEVFVYLFLPFTASAMYLQSLEASYLVYACINSLLFFVVGLVYLPFMVRKTKTKKGLGRY